MLSSKILREILKTVFDVKDKYLVPMNEGWFVPTVPVEEKVGDWIGYRINNLRPYARAYVSGKAYTKPVKVKFRVTFVGPNAEEFAQQTLFWEDRTDVTEAFEKYGVQINYNERSVYSYPIKNKGFNDYCAWVVDFSAQTNIDVETHWKPWRKYGS